MAASQRVLPKNFQDTRRDPRDGKSFYYVGRGAADFCVSSSPTRRRRQRRQARDAGSWCCFTGIVTRRASRVNRTDAETTSRSRIEAVQPRLRDRSDKSMQREAVVKRRKLRVAVEAPLISLKDISTERRPIATSRPIATPFGGTY